MTTYQVISPDTKSIVDKDFYINIDHVPPTSLHDFDGLTLEEKQNILFGYNSLYEMFLAVNKITDDLVIIDTTGNQTIDKISTLYLNLFFVEESEYYCNEIDIDDNYFHNFTSKSVNFNVIMNKIRPDRLLTSCWLYNNQHDYDFVYTQSWNSEEVEVEIYELLQIGGLTDYKNSAGLHLKTMPKNWVGETYGGSNAINFKNIASETFYPSAVSVVVEPVFWENACHITEKYLNALYGLTIPIVSGYKCCDCLSKMGFDIFDDIVDTSYQYIENPVLRTWEMMERNKDLLNRGLELINDNTIQDRIIKNLEWARKPKEVFETAFMGLNGKKEKEFFVQNYVDIKEILLIEEPKTMAVIDLDKMYSLLKNQS